MSDQKEIEKNGAKSNKLQRENEQLKSELEELKATMKQMLESQNSPKSESNDDYLDEEFATIPPTRLIQVTSLFHGGMTLKGAHDKPIRFDYFGMKRPISFDDLTYVCSNHRSLAENGNFFIHNKDVIDALYLTDHYKRFINKQTIEDFITLSDDEIKSIYVNVTDDIKEVIVDIVFDGAKRHMSQGDHKYSNRDKIDLISKLCGKDIYKLAQDAVEEQK